MRLGQIRLLSREHLVKTGPVDYADWNYRSLIGTIQRLRFALALSLLPPRSRRLLEVGFGSGVFVPSLDAIADQVFGIDVHDEGARVKKALASQGFAAELVRSPAEAIPFASGSFDSIVAISALEFVSDLPGTCAEIRRVLKPGGSFVVVTPGNSPLVDAGLRALTGKSAKNDFGDRREMIIPTLLRFFTAQECRAVPRVGNSVVCLYRAFRLTATEPEAKNGRIAGQ